eukprot:jgi/Psemu1/42142/gm1.42142_g
MTNHCPKWVDDEPTCATNFASMEFPIFARDTEGMEASAAGPVIQLAQSWETPRLGEDLFQQSDAKMHKLSDNISWNSSPFNVDDSDGSSSSPPSP